MSITLNGTTGIIADSPATVKANAFLDAAGGNTATINGKLPIALADVPSASADIQTFSSTGTWTKPAGAKVVYVEIWGAGGGGGSGNRLVNTASNSGGGGGGGAAGVFCQFIASDLSSTVSVTIGAGGAGGTSVTTDTTVGRVGSAGGNSTFGAYLTGLSGGGGGGGGTVYQNGSVGGYGPGWTDPYASLANDQPNNISYGGRLPSSGSITGPYFSNIFGGAAGANGYNGSIYSGGNILKPGTGAAGGGAGGAFANTTLYNAGVGGTRGGSTVESVANTGVGLGAAGAAGSGFGNGGGGGGHGRTAAAGAGGAGATAAGGGGGGGSANGFASGAGGAGGNGYCRVTTYF